MLYQVTIPIAPNIDGAAPMDLGIYFSNIIGAALTVAAVATLIYLIWGGVSWITAGGDEKKVAEARNRITNAVIGLAIVAVSWALFLILDNFLGIGIAGAQSDLGFDDSNPPGDTAPPPADSNLGDFVGVAACPCNNNGCARLNARSPLTTDCRICTASGWAPVAGSCTSIQCGRCH